jgi:hypothetical protein
MVEQKEFKVSCAWSCVCVCVCVCVRACVCVCVCVCVEWSTLHACMFAHPALGEPQSEMLSSILRNDPGQVTTCSDICQHRLDAFIQYAWTPNTHTHTHTQHTHHVHGCVCARILCAFLVTGCVWQACGHDHPRRRIICINKCVWCKPCGRHYEAWARNLLVQKESIQSMFHANFEKGSAREKPR